METNYAVIRNSPLFAGMSDESLASTLSCLRPVRRRYNKNEIIYHAGETIDAIGMPLGGRIHIVQEDFWGNRSILGDAGVGELFGDAYACLPDEKLRVSIVMAEPGEVMFFNIDRLLTACANACERHTLLIRNLSMVIAGKNLLLTRKLSVLARRSIREKLVGYLSGQAALRHSAAFEIPYSRQELADYLCVDRSALSRELCRLRDEGVLTFRRNRFRLLAVSGELHDER